MTSHTADEVSEASASGLQPASALRPQRFRTAQIDLLGALYRMTEERPLAVQIGRFTLAT
jgi:hypothetical protein